VGERDGTDFKRTHYKSFGADIDSRKGY